VRAASNDLMIDLRYVKKLIELMDDSTVDSIEISTDKGMKIRISKSSAQRGSAHLASSVPVLQTPVVDPRTTPVQSMLTVPQEPEAAPRVAPSPGLEVKSPMVGTFYQSPEPGSKPYVAVGMRVTKGQILCIIEAMKIMNEIESEYAGLITEVGVQDAQPVEYGQVLFRIDPNG
jgi:acetyl-CoA carboxylase biotin carboxyl carrier protein